MDVINGVLTTIGDWVLGPLGAWSPLGALVVVSIVSGVVMAWIYGRTSNQQALREYADRARAQLLGMKLFNEDALVVLRYQVDLFKMVGLRLAHAAPPVIVLIVPFFFVLTQLALRYEHRPLAPGESVVVAMTLNPVSWEATKNVAVEALAGAGVETPALRDAVAHMVSWRVRFDEGETAPLLFKVDGSILEKRITGADDARSLPRVSERRAGRSLWDRLLHPGEAAVPAGSPVRSIVIHYPRRSTPILGIDLPWWATFLIVSILAALAASPFLKVKF